MIQQNLQIVCFSRLLSASCCLSCVCALYSCLSETTLLFTTEMPSALIDLSKLSKVFHSALPHVFTAALHRFNLGRFNKHTVHSLIQAINKILNGSSEQLSTHPICPLHFTVSHCKLLSGCRFHPDLCQDFSQGILHSWMSPGTMPGASGVWDLLLLPHPQTLIHWVASACFAPEGFM